MTKARQSVVVLIALAVAALALLVTFMGDSPLNSRHVLQSIESPGEGDNALTANITSGRTRGGTDTEVQIAGHWRGAKVDEVVMRSDFAKPDMLRVGWAGESAVVISVPQSLQDAGKPLGADDAGFHCGGDGPIHVTCQAYTIGPSNARHYEPPPAPHSQGR